MKTLNSESRENRMKLQCTKKAWIRDEGYPFGRPAPGHFNCACGEVVPCPVFGQAEHVTCKTCGQVYDGCGWLVEKGV